MGFINNTSYILNAVLTKKGKEYLAKSNSRFNVAKFALSDDEVDYELWNTAHPLGSDYFGAVIESCPIVEPCVDPEVVMKYKLFTVPVGTKVMPYIQGVSPSTGFNESNALTYTVDNLDLTDPTPDGHDFTGITTGGVGGEFTNENYSFLILNTGIVDIASLDGTPSNDDYVPNETGRLSKRIITGGRPAGATTGGVRVTAAGFWGHNISLTTSLIITGQSSGATYVVPITAKGILIE